MQEWKTACEPEGKRKAPWVRVAVGDSASQGLVVE